MSSKAALASTRIEDQDFLDRLIAEQLGRPGALLTVLERAQDRQRNKFLPQEILEYVAARMGVPQARVFGVATFYAFFNLEPQGTHSVCICRGTACHTGVRESLLERLKLELGVAQSTTDDAGSADKLSVTTQDRRFTVRTVACFGQCALAPVVEVNHAIHGHVNERALLREVDALRREGGR